MKLTIPSVFSILCLIMNELNNSSNLLFKTSKYQQPKPHFLSYQIK